MTKQLRRILADNSLSDGARIMALYIATRPAGEWHEIPHAEFARVLHGYPSSDTIGRYARQLEVAGYVENRRGGRDHPQAYRIIEPHQCGPKDITPHESGPIPTSVRTGAELNDTVVVERETVVVPPIVPQLDPKAEAALAQHNGKLEGCRGALTDYIAQLPARRQYAYVQTVASYLDDIDPSVWRLPTGGWLPKEKRPGVLAVALNELAAGDESTMKRPVGDPGNLKTKINILLREPVRYERKQRGNGGGAAAPAGGETVSLEAARRRRGFGAA